MTAYSLCIPRIFNNIPDNKITSTFENLNIGKIKSIDIIDKIGRDGSTFKMAFVHFESWNYYNSSAVNLRKQIEDPNLVAKIVYDDPWHWILLPNTSNVASDTNNAYCLYNQQSVSSTNLHERLTKLENEIRNVSEELYRREYTPVEHLQKSTWNDDDESKNDSGNRSSVMPMNIHELDIDDSQSLNEEYNMNAFGELHKMSNPANYIPFYNNEDDDMSLVSTISCQYYNNEHYDYSCDIENDNNISISYLERVNQNNKLWVTANCCGND